jgi:hypothetical protein
VTGAEIVALVEAATAIAGKLASAAIEHAKSAEEALAHLDAIDMQLDNAIADLKARVAANDAAIDAERKAHN